MCGRFALANPKLTRIEAVLGASFSELMPRFNIAPTQQIPVVRPAGGGYELAAMRWGLIPHWAKDAKPGLSTFNARAETAETRPAFRVPFRSRRCLIPASGFYEWRKEGDRKRPFYFTDAEGYGFAFAGLWDSWRGGDEEVRSCTILVCPPNALLSAVHDRMPVILPEDAYAKWLDASTPLDAIRSLLNPYPAERMTGWPVGAAVGNARNDSPALIKPVQAPPNLL